MTKPLRILFAAMFAISVVPIWWFPIFPSQDGPAHLYNALVLADYQRVPAYREFYEIRLTAAGNLLSQLLMVLLVKLFPLFIADKIIVTLCVLLLPLALRYLLQSIDPDLAPLSFLGFVLAFSFFLHAGFWNFCLGVPLAFFTLGYFLRHRDESTFLTAAKLAGLSAVCYTAHLVAWGMLIAAVAAILAGCRNASRRPSLVLLLAASVPAIFFLRYATEGSHAVHFTAGQYREKAEAILGLRFLHGYAASDTTLAVWLARISSILVAAGIAVGLLGSRRQFLNPFLFLAALLAVAAWLGPESFGTGAYLRERLSLFAFIFLFTGMGAAGCFRGMMPYLALLLSVFAIAGMWGRRESYRQWSGILAEYAAAAPHVQPGSTVLPLRGYEGERPLHPTLHAAGVLAPRPFIDLRNYQALSEVFPVRFRLLPPGLDPPLDRLQGVRADYILVEGRPGDENVPAGEGHATLVYVSQPTGRVRLYRVDR